MSTKFHGVRFDESSTTSGWIHFGFLRLLHVIYNFQYEKYPAWPNKWLDRKFSQAVIKFEDCFWKFNRVAELFFGCLETFKRYHNSLKVGDVESSERALQDIQIYLDSMLFYLRIQLECLADVIPNLYGQRGSQQSIARNGFTDHKSWFTKKRKDFDPKYTSILELESNRDWFKLLVGEGKGPGRLRDVVTHQRGVYQLDWSIPGMGAGLGLWAALVGDSGFAEEDVVVAIKSIVTGYFLFLDELYQHFGELLRVEVGEEFIKADSKMSKYKHFTGGTLPSFWVYPLILTNPTPNSGLS
jgi:hypothetical protein